MSSLNGFRGEGINWGRTLPVLSALLIARVPNALRAGEGPGDEKVPAESLTHACSKSSLLSQVTLVESGLVLPSLLLCAQLLLLSLPH